MYPQILSKMVPDTRYLRLNRDCYNQKNLFYHNSSNKPKIFMKACIHNKYEIVEYLLRYEDICESKISLNKGAEIYRDKNNILRLREYDLTLLDYSLIKSSRKGNTKIVKLLLQKTKVDSSRYRYYPFRWACKQENVKLIKILINYEKLINSYHIFLPYAIDIFIDSVNKGRLKTVKIFLENNILPSDILYNVYNYESLSLPIKHKFYYIYTWTGKYHIIQKLIKPYI